MTAAMLVLEPIFEADLPPEQYAYRPGRNAQQAVPYAGEPLVRFDERDVETEPRSNY
jgi:RNA-directed DNA polymerase